MKKILITLMAVAATFSLHAQGRVAFSSNAAFPIQAHGANISGSGTYRFGLYVGPAGTPAAALELVMIGQNGAVPGNFNVANPFILPSSTSLSPGGYPAGTAIAFQIRGWTLAAGTSYEAALLSGGGNLNNVFGQTLLGSANPTASPAGAAVLFGVGNGQVPGFDMEPVVPEPSTIALALLGGALLLFRRRK